jgi:hypothetical protein
MRAILSNFERGVTALSGGDSASGAAVFPLVEVDAVEVGIAGLLEFLDDVVLGVRALEHLAGHVTHVLGKGCDFSVSSFIFHNVSGLMASTVKLFA